jgi:hypothetical protein
MGCHHRPTFLRRFLIARLPGAACSSSRRKLVTASGTIAIWTFVSVSLLLWHEAVVRIRWSVSPQTLALNRVVIATAALRDYAKDCGRFPSQEQGLGALCQNPGIAKWSGPYLSSDELIDPWGNPLQYRILDNAVEVWSLGPDGLNGTEDDIHWKAEPHK